MKAWVDQVVVGLNFCPFAKKEVVNNKIHYPVCEERKPRACLAFIAEQVDHLQAHPEIETSVLIFPAGLESFYDFLDLLDMANQYLVDEGFEGEFQFAHFHPDYCFADLAYDDAANYTNRAPYPALHLLREESLEKAISLYKQPEQIPEDNIALARKMGSEAFRRILQECLTHD